MTTEGKVHPARVAENLLPFSEAQTVTLALREWHYTGNCVDHGPDADEICELCDHRGLRHHFEIQNDITSHLLWVGSRCIKKFDIAGAAEVGADLQAMKRAFAQKEMEKQEALDREMEQERSRIRTEERLAAEAREDEEREVIHKIRKIREQFLTRIFKISHGRFNVSGSVDGLTPKQALWALRIAWEHDRKPSLAEMPPILLETTRQGKDLLAMPRAEAAILWPYLTKAQKDAWREPLRERYRRETPR